MFKGDSRYADLEQRTYEAEDGREINYVSRRIVPDARRDHTRGEVVVQPEERLDHASENAFGAPKQYWRLCDANRVMNPRTVDEDDARSLVIPIPTEGT